MPLQADSRAVQVARANLAAWTNHDLAATRAGVADNFTLTVSTTQPGGPPEIRTTGIDDYMARTEEFVKTVTPGSVKEIGALGDDRNALLMFTLEADVGQGKAALANARVYSLDDEGKIAAEHVLFFLGS